MGGTAKILAKFWIKLGPGNRKFREETSKKCAKVNLIIAGNDGVREFRMELELGKNMATKIFFFDHWILLIIWKINVGNLNKKLRLEKNLENYFSLKIQKNEDEANLWNSGILNFFFQWKFFYFHYKNSNDD